MMIFFTKTGLIRVDLELDGVETGKTGQKLSKSAEEP